MAGVYKRKSDRKREKSGKWTMWWIDENGKQRTKVGFTDKKASKEFADKKEAEARMIREGFIDPAELARKQSAGKSVEDHVRDYRAVLIARGDTEKYATHATNAVLRLLADASVESVAAIAPDRIQNAIARLRSSRSVRTANFSLNAIKSFARWLEDSERIKQMPRGLRLLKRYPAKSDPRRIRRAITEDELARLLEVAASGRVKVTRRAGLNGPPVGRMDGSDRVMLYRLAMATGFRANELRQLTPERFNLDGDSPSITCLASNSKRGKKSGKDDVQPIRRDMAAIFREFIKGKPPGVPILAVPANTATMLRADLEAAGIPYRDGNGHVLDFHALRVSYITALVRSGANIKVVQSLARHSTITLTMDVYAKVEGDDVRAALEGDATRGDGPPPAHG